MKSLVILIFMFINFTNLVSQQVAIEFGNRSWYSKFNGNYQGLSLTFDIGKRWEIGPNLTTSNHTRNEDYTSIISFLPFNPDPIQSAYRIKNGRTMVDSPEFYRGIGTTSTLLNGRSFESNWLQYVGLGVSVAYNIISTDRLLWYVRVIPSLQRERREYIQTIIHTAKFKLNDDDEFKDVFYTEKQVSFKNIFGLQYGTGLTYQVYGKLSIGLDISYYGVSFAPAFMVRYKIK